MYYIGFIKKKVKIFLIKFIEEDNYYIQSRFLRRELFALAVKVKKIISSVEISPALLSQVTVAAKALEVGRK